MVGAKKWRGHLAGMGIRDMLLVAWMMDRLESIDIAVLVDDEGMCECWRE